MRILMLSMLFLVACTEYHMYNGYKKAEKGDYQGAFEAFNKAIELDPKLAEDSKIRGIDFRSYLRAIADYNKAIKLDPKFAIAYFNRGNNKCELSDNEGACLDWSKAGELGFLEACD